MYPHLKVNSVQAGVFLAFATDAPPPGEYLWEAEREKGRREDFQIRQSLQLLSCVVASRIWNLQTSKLRSGEFICLRSDHNQWMEEPGF